MKHVFLYSKAPMSYLSAPVRATTYRPENLYAKSLASIQFSQVMYMKQQWQCKLI